jgi:peptidoglycan/LPS O-acetylase OafA/YrhL
VKPVVALALLLGGAVVGVAAVALHTIWWGLLLGGLATAATVYALPAGWWLRAPFGVGWAGLVAYLSVPRPEGDYVISSDANGYLLLGLALVVLAVSLATLPRPTTRRAKTGNGRSAS